MSAAEVEGEEAWQQAHERLRERILSGRAASDAPRAAPTGQASVVVAVRNGEAVLDRCLRALAAQERDRFEVIVVDDGSRDRSLELARSHRGVRLESCDGRGAAAARNVGVRLARGEVLAFVDADGFAHPGWLDAAATELARDPSIGAVASLVFFDRCRSVINGAGATLDVRGYGHDNCFGESIETAELPAEALYAMGCGLVCRRTALEEVGGFDEDLAHFYEDAELCIRLWRAGWRVVLAPGAWIDHRFGHSRAAGESRVRKDESGRIRTMLAHMPLRRMPRWLVAEAAWLVIPSEVRRLRQQAWAWNLWRLPGTLGVRRRWSRFPGVPRDLMLPGRAKFPEDPEPPQGRWLYGWFAPLQIEGRAARWGTCRAGLRLPVREPASAIEWSYRTPPRSNGATVELRRAGEVEPLLRSPLHPTSSWRTHRLETGLEPGEYELVFATESYYEDARRRRRAIAIDESGPLTKTG